MKRILPNKSKSNDQRTGSTPVAGRQRIRDLLGTLLAPAVAEASGAIADQVRLYRWQRAVRILEKAREFANDHGVKKCDVPIKFLVPFLERASTEDDERLEVQWARLLVSAANDYDATKQLLADCLSRMGYREAKVLRLFAVADGCGNPPFASALGRANLAIEADVIWNLFTTAMDSAERGDKSYITGPANEAFKHAIVQGAIPFLFGVSGPWQMNGDQDALLHGPVAAYQKELNVLRNLDLISGQVIDEKFYTDPFNSSKVASSERCRLRFQFMWFQLTALGEEFLKVCDGQLPSAPKHLENEEWAELLKGDTEAPKKRKARKRRAE